MPKLQLRGVRKSYGATTALVRGDLEIEAGEVHVLIGSNGSGKSTLCKIVAGSVQPDAGTVLLDGEPVTLSGPRAARARGIGVFYQELSLAAHRSVAENISLAALPTTVGAFVDRAAVDRTARRYIEPFAAVAGDGFGPDAVVGDLRADQRQLVEIMKALATEAPVLILDEPTSALDRAQVECFFDILRNLKAAGRSIVFISHRMDEIFAIGDRVTVIRDGETVGTERLAATSPEAVIRLMVGDRVVPTAATPARPAAPGDAALQVRGLLGPGLAGVSFDVAAGEIVGLGGLHGQGQSRVLQTVFGARAASGGNILVRGRPLAAGGPRAAIRQGCAYVSGDRSRDGVIPGRPILENLTPVHFLLNRMAFARPSSLSRRAMPALEALSTKFRSIADPVTTLSGGNQQKVVIARWLIDRPAVLLLDDPTKGIDLATKTELFALVRRLAADGIGVVLYSSEDAELLGNADRILVFNGGAITRTLAGTDRTRFNLYHAAYEAA